MTSRWTILVVAGLFALPACSKHQTASQPMVPAAGAVSKGLTDAQIWQVAESIHRGQMAEARLVERKADSRELVDFARHVHRVHTGALAAERDETSRAGVQPGASPLAEREAQRTADDLQLLDGLSGPRFDRAYVDKETRDDEALLRTIDHELLPHARSSELRTELSALRASIVEQLERLHRLREELETHPHASGVK